ncbi:choice-of-anchor G family protein, partial [Microbacterium hydrothermale]|uniref:choice-of-anchor G family protein n=1 Tax=Microbacterium hydrothermale TaxID=857427 RepID=UPI00142DBAA5
MAGGAWTTTRGGRTAVKTAAALGAVSLSLFGGISAAQAAPGDVSRASGTFLSGTILDAIPLGAIADLDGALASSTGTGSTVTDANTLDLTALGVVNVTAPGGVQIPVDLGSAGVLGQYASAAPDASSVGAAGAIGEGGVIGNGVPPADGVAPGPLSVSLDAAVDTLAGSLAADLVEEIATLDLQLDAVSARAAKAAPDAATGEYTIAGGQLVIGSETLAAVSAELSNAVDAIEGDVVGLDTALEVALSGVLPLPGVGVDLTVGAGLDLSAAVDELLTGQLTSPDYPGVVIDLSTGTITVDLDQIQDLNNLPAGTNIIGGTALQSVEDSVVALVSGLVDDVVERVVTAVGDASVKGQVTQTLLGTTTLLSIDTTLGGLLAGDPVGLTLGPISLPIGLQAIADLLAVPIDGVVGGIAPALEALLGPVNEILVPALDDVIPAVATVTVNNRTAADAEVFSITAALVTILPGSIATTIALATASVGPNEVDAAPIVPVAITTPAEGAILPATGVLPTASVPVGGTGEPDAVVTVVVTGGAGLPVSQTTTVLEDGTWTVTFTDVAVGTYSATATQDVDGSTQTRTFGVAADVADADAADVDVLDADILDIDADGAD